jgi:hypothetical protein
MGFYIHNIHFLGNVPLKETVSFNNLRFETELSYVFVSELSNTPLIRHQRYLRHR